MRQTSRFAALVLLSSLSLASQAGTFRAYLSVNGNDANPCSLSAPCRLTDAALTAVNDGGEIWFMDSGNFNLGTLNITRSVSIVAVPGAIASIFSISGPAVNIATAGVKVSLKNLVIKSLTGFGSTSGVVVTSGTSLTIEGCTIADMPQQGIDISAAIKVQISDTTVRNSGSYGILLDGGVAATISRSSVVGGGGFGIYAAGSSGNVTYDVRDSILANNTFTGAVAVSSGSFTTKVAISNSQLTGNSFGFASAASGASVVKGTLSGNLIANNTSNGAQINNPGSIFLFSDNTISGNTNTGLVNAGGTINSTLSNSVSGNGTSSSGTITTVGKI